MRASEIAIAVGCVLLNPALACSGTWPDLPWREAFTIDPVASRTWRAYGADDFAWHGETGHEAPGSLRVGGTDRGGRVAGPFLAVGAGEMVRGAVWVKTRDAANDVHIRLEWHGDGGRVGETKGGAPFGRFMHVPNKIGGTRPWTRLLVRGYAPAGSVAVRLVLWCPGNADRAGGGTVWWDDASLAPVPLEHQLGRLDRDPRPIAPAALEPDDYVTVRHGHLVRGGRRLRIWSAQGSLLARNHADIDLEVERFAAHGFNGYRSLWWNEEVVDDYVPGDRSTQDRRDYLIAALGRRGVLFWSDLLNSCQIRPEQVDVIDEADTATAWTDAVRNMGGKRGYVLVRQMLPIVWDARVQHIYHDYIRRVLNHRNPHNGLRYAEDPTFFCWELTNEQWWLMRILWGNHLKLPAFFQRGLHERWNRWLAAIHGDDASLRRAWGGLLEGESLGDRSVLLLPLLEKADVGALAAVLGLDVRFEAAATAAVDFDARRAADVIRFLTHMIIASKQAAARVFRGQAASGLGAALVPIVYDTGHSGAVLPFHVHSFGDATAAGTYVDMTMPRDPQSPTFPFGSGLRRPPSLSGWIDTRRVLGKPAFIYENMTFNPQKYRAEYAYRLLALVSIQDHDVVDFHYYGHPRAFPRVANPHTRHALRYMETWSNWEGTTMRTDAMLMSTVRIAGAIFKRRLLRPAAPPTVVTLGSRRMWSFDGLFGRPHVEAAGHTVFRRGFRWAFAPGQDEDTITGELVDPAAVKDEPVVQPTTEISYRWQEGVLVIDAPAAKALVGFVPGQFTFADGTTLADITIRHDDGMSFIVPGERYVAIGMVALDGRPLSTSRHVLLSAVSTSHNRGLAIDEAKLAADKRYAAGLNAAITDRGGLPVLYARVGLTLQAPWLKGASCTMSDYNGDILFQGRLAGPSLALPPELPVHLTELVRAP